jgi:hypothetical protein
MLLLLAAAPFRGPSPATVALLVFADLPPSVILHPFLSSSALVQSSTLFSPTQNK